MDTSTLTFESNGLYILLLDRGEDTFTFHWAFYLAKPKAPNSGGSGGEGDGIIFHVINPASSTEWIYESKTSKDDGDVLQGYSRRLILALKIAVMDPVLHEPLSDRLAQIPIDSYSTRFHENITCRVWVKEALFALDEEGFIKLTASVDAIEAEAMELALRNKARRVRTIAESSGCIFS
jgi:hypothetical protein